MGCCQSHLLANLQHDNQAYLESNAQRNSTNNREFVHALLSAIQETHRKLKVNRRKRYPCLANNRQHQEYIKDILGDLKREQEAIGETLRVLTAQLGTPVFDDGHAIKDDIQSYIEQRRISKSQVEAWLRSKTEVIRTDGKKITQQVSSFRFDHGEKEHCWQVVQIMVDDHLENSKDFLLSIAYEFIWKEELTTQSQAWEASLRGLYPTVAFLQS